METFPALLDLCVGNRDVGDFRRHRVHYDVTVMFDQIMEGIESGS